jgi:hypothetical protein
MDMEWLTARSLLRSGGLIDQSIVPESELVLEDKFTEQSGLEL